MMQLLQTGPDGALHGLLNGVNQPLPKALGCCLDLLLKSIQTLHNTGHLLANRGKPLCWIPFLQLDKLTIEKVGEIQL